MNQYYLSETYMEASSRVDEACEWLESLGIDYSRTRVGRYKEVLGTLAAHQDKGTLERFADEYSVKEFVNAVYEVAELKRIHEGLCAIEDAQLVARIRDALKGHHLYVGEKPDRSGRDFSLELAVAAKFALRGYEIDFGSRADLRTEIDGYPLYVECKRLKSIKQAVPRIKEGLRQLHKRYGDSRHPKKTRGLLVISIGKAINSDLGLIEADTPEEVGDAAAKHSRAFVDSYKEVWQSDRDSRTLGVAVVLDTPGVILSNGQFTTCHQVTLNNAVPVNSREHELLMSLAQRIFPR